MKKLQTISFVGMAVGMAFMGMANANLKKRLNTINQQFQDYRMEKKPVTNDTSLSHIKISYEDRHWRDLPQASSNGIITVDTSQMQFIRLKLSNNPALMPVGDPLPAGLKIVSDGIGRFAIKDEHIVYTSSYSSTKEGAIENYKDFLRWKRDRNNIQWIVVSNLTNQ